MTNLTKIIHHQVWLLPFPANVLWHPFAWLHAYENCHDNFWELIITNAHKTTGPGYIYDSVALICLSWLASSSHVTAISIQDLPLRRKYSFLDGIHARLSSPRLKALFHSMQNQLASSLRWMHLIKVNCLALWLDRSICSEIASWFLP